MRPIRGTVRPIWRHAAVLGFERGQPIALDGIAMGAVAIMKKLNALGVATASTRHSQVTPSSASKAASDFPHRRIC
jgi:hypothetical protein